MRTITGIFEEVISPKPLERSTETWGILPVNYWVLKTILFNRESRNTICSNFVVYGPIDDPTEFLSPTVSGI